VREAAETCCHVQRRAAIAAVRQLDSLARVDPDPDPEREPRAELALVGEARLQVDGGADRLPRRGEHGEALVPAHLDQLAAVHLHALAHELLELGCEPRGRFVACSSV